MDINMLNNLLCVAGIAIWGYILVSILKIKESFGPVLAIAVSMAVLEIGGAFGVLWPTAIVYCSSACILSGAYIAQTRNVAQIKTYFLNPSIIGFLFAALFYMIVTSGKILFYTELDSFFHWGMFSKAVFYDHNFDIWNNSLCVNHRVYPHGMSAWYSLFALGKSVYAERDVMLSINVLLFASSCPIVDAAIHKIRTLLPNKKIFLPVIYFVSGISIASFLWIWKFEKICAYTSGYMDIPLGAVFMAALCLVVTDTESCYRKAFGISLISAMLIMIKPSGIIFVGGVCLAYLVYEYISAGLHRTFHDIGRLIRVGGVAVFIPLIELGIWNAIMKYLHITGGDQFRLREFLPSTVISKYQSDSDYAELFYVIIQNFLKAFFTREVTPHISAFGWMALCSALAAITILLQKDCREKKKILYVNICMLLLFCFYNLFLLWTYLTTMSKGEAVNIVCYDRYIGTCIIGWFALCIYLLFFYSVGSWKVQYLYLCMFFLCNIWGLLQKNTYLKDINVDIMDTCKVRDDVKECITGITYDEIEDMPDLWISYADKEEALSYDQAIQLKYYLFPDFDFINVYGIQENYQRQMRDIINEFSFDYLVLYGVNEDFYDNYYWFFADGLSNAKEQDENGHCQAYKVIRDEITNEFCWFEPL